MNQVRPENVRWQAMLRWLDAALPAHDDPLPASSDASFRRYFRVFSGSRSWIVMDAPPAQEDSRPFVAVCRWLAEQGLRVPVIHTADLDAGFLLLDDLGSMTYLAALAEADPDPLYRAAIDALVTMQAAAPPSLPDYDETLLARELALFHDWYLERHRGFELSPGEAADWQAVCAQLIAAARAQPQVFVHRDYHSRNLMTTPGEPPGILDFQDAVRGPLTYDLVSLLRDCYVAWPPERVAGWLAYYRTRAAAVGLPVPAEERFARDFDWMGVQRHLKAAGIFARLSHRDGKDGFLADIPRTLGYVRDATARYPELAPLNRLVRRCLN